MKHETFARSLVEFLDSAQLSGRRLTSFLLQAKINPERMKRWKRGSSLPSLEKWKTFCLSARQAWPPETLTGQLLQRLDEQYRRDHTLAMKAQLSGRRLDDHSLYETDRSSRISEGARLAAIPKFQSDIMVRLQARRDFPRPDELVAAANCDIMLIGINLAVAAAALSTLKEKTRAGVSLRFLCLDPKGSTLDPFSRFSGVSAAHRQTAIEDNINILVKQLRRLPVTVKWEVRKIDSFLSIGVIATDIDHEEGVLIAQTYLYKTAPDEAPTITLCRRDNYFWFSIYKESIVKLWNAGKMVAKSKVGAN